MRLLRGLERLLERSNWGTVRPETSARSGVFDG
jgi:hypothetical protein